MICDEIFEMRRRVENSNSLVVYNGISHVLVVVHGVSL
jgi:hypothetical protein